MKKICLLVLLLSVIINSDAQIDNSKAQKLGVTDYIGGFENSSLYYFRLAKYGTRVS